MVEKSLVRSLKGWRLWLGGRKGWNRKKKNVSLLFSSWFLGREGKEAAESEGKRKRNASGRHGVLEKKGKTRPLS